MGGAVWHEEQAVVGAGQGSRGRGHPESERRKESSRADIEGAQTSENLNEMRAVQAVSQVIDSANVRNYGEPQREKDQEPCSLEGSKLLIKIGLRIPL